MKSNKSTTNNIPDPQNTMKLNSRKRVQLFFTEPTLTKQSFKQECDINHIVAKFSETGHLPMTNNLPPQYGESPNLDLKESLDQVKSLHEEFFQLPYEIRKTFENKPENYANFLSEYEADPEAFDKYYDSLLKTSPGDVVVDEQSEEISTSKGEKKSTETG